MTTKPNSGLPCSSFIFWCAVRFNKFVMEMNTREIDAVLKNCKTTQRYFRGTHQADFVPDMSANERPAAWVLNNERGTSPGQHWIAAFLTQQNRLIYFDSCADEPNEDLLKFLSYFPSVTRMEFRIQDYFSELCGQYCVYFVFCLSKGRPFSKFCSKFSRTNLASNDRFVRSWIMKFLRKHVSLPLSELVV